MLGGKSLESVRLHNKMLCEKVTSLRRLSVSKCYLIGATTFDDRLQVMLTKTHLNKEGPKTCEKMGRNLFLLSCRVSNDVLKADLELAQLLGINKSLVHFVPYVSFKMYFLVEEEHLREFAFKVWEKSHFSKYTSFSNFSNCGKFIYCRYKEKDFDEYVALADVAQLDADFLIEQKVGGIFSSRKRMVLKETRKEDDSCLGAVGGVSYESQSMVLREAKREEDSCLGTVGSQISLDSDDYNKLERVVKSLEDISKRFDSMIKLDNALPYDVKSAKDHASLQDVSVNRGVVSRSCDRLV